MNLSFFHTPNTFFLHYTTHHDVFQGYMTGWCKREAFGYNLQFSEQHIKLNSKPPLLFDCGFGAVSPNRFKGVFQGGKSKSPLEFVLLLCRKAKKIRVFYKLTTYVVAYGITFNHLITACGGASPQGEAFGLV
ncbi:MAG: hypothetical protein IJP38_10080, partial [Oscillospiraceae bacterium]|nr:hypothetical protein [Oscillospiraceae bacterium]